MRNNVYFMGGSKGTGKSSLLREVSKLTGIDIINTGDFFSNRCPKEIAINQIINSLNSNYPIIADTHYAAHTNGIYSGGFERALSHNKLAQLDRKVNLTLCLLDLDSTTLYKRRKNDEKNGRDMDISNIVEELDKNRIFFNDYCKQLKKKGTIILNQNFEDSMQRIFSIISEGEKQ